MSLSKVDDIVERFRESEILNVLEMDMILGWYHREGTSQTLLQQCVQAQLVPASTNVRWKSTMQRWDCNYQIQKQLLSPRTFKKDCVKMKNCPVVWRVEIWKPCWKPLIQVWSISAYVMNNMPISEGSIKLSMSNETGCGRTNAANWTISFSEKAWLCNKRDQVIN